MITTLAVENYRSLRRLVVPLDRLNVITGANGTGKSSLYRALRLLAASARGGAVRALAQEGGLPSVLWAGERDTGPVGLRLGFAGDEFGYAVDFGMPPSSGAGPGGAASMFALDPEIKRESTWAGPVLRPAALLCDRAGPSVRTRTADGGWHRTQGLRLYDSMLSEVADPQLAPDLLRLRELIRSWRFYDHVRTDADAPARAARIGTRTPVLAHDGSDLAAALQTIYEIGDDAALDAAVADAFPGSRVRIVDSAGGRFEIQLTQRGLKRPLGPAELSDGTLRYLLWTAALLTPRPPGLLVLNEPETSLHPELLAPLAHLVLAAANASQVVVVTHARPLADALARGAPRHRVDVNSIELIKESGRTTVAGREGLLDEPLWYWPKR
ncbi:AAA family ATPase [Streptomyces sp. SID8379]|uniref:AAA family ATPase n=1 Tax=unclassified Streptomyces TaxID=2593676 RepID=UPI0003758FB0|nr:AAA family ATPase [Streptomyces sp. HmicA12]MYW69642.1 AAA family ATPase [Streptomyces sp. SID8379]